MKRIDWRLPAALAALLAVITVGLLLVAVLVRPYRDVLDHLDTSAARSACITDARTALDVAEADLFLTAIDRTQAAPQTDELAALRAQIVVARDRIAHLNDVCPGGTP